MTYPFKPKLYYNKDRDFGGNAFVLKLWNSLVFLAMFFNKKIEKKTLYNRFVTDSRNANILA